MDEKVPAVVHRAAVWPHVLACGVLVAVLAAPVSVRGDGPPRLLFVPPGDTALARTLSSALSAHATLVGPDALPVVPTDPWPARRAAQAVAQAEAAYGDARPEDALAAVRGALEHETAALAAAGDVASLGRLVLWEAIALAKTGHEADARAAFRAARSLGAGTPDPLRFPPDVVALVPPPEPAVPTEIESLPAGASIEVLGATAEQGTTPARLELPPGRYVLRVRRPGHEPEARLIDAGGRVEVALREASGPALAASLAALRDAGVLDLADPANRRLLALALVTDGRVDASVDAGRLELTRFDHAGHRVARAFGPVRDAESLVTALFRTTRSPAAPGSTSIFGRWWFWASVGAVVAGAVTVGLVLANQKPDTITYRSPP